MYNARPTAVRRAAILVAVALGACGGAGLHAGAATSQADRLTRISVGYVAGAAGSAAASAAALGGRTLATLPQIDAEVVGVPPQQAGATIAALRVSPGIRYAELDGRAFALATPNDPFWPDEWSEARTHAPAVWDLTTGSHSVVVAVVDTGVDASQPDLAPRVLPGPDFVNGDSDASDDQGHGTAVAGIVAATGNNGIGTAGYCWQCRILPVKVLGSDGAGFDSWVAQGIIWAVDHGAKVVNASLGSPTDDLTVAAAAHYAVQHGALLVAAAGNDGSTTLDYPAALPGVISVSATDPNDQPYSFSNTGAALAAPGENATTGLGSTYVSFLGTSSAAPVVSGIAGLAFSAVAPTPGASDVARALEATAVPSPGAVYGRVDASATLTRLAPQLRPIAPASTSPTKNRADGRRNTASMTFHGRLTQSHRRRTYTFRTGTGLLRATVSSHVPHGARLVARLVAPDGSVIARGETRGQLRFSAGVDSLGYRLVLTRRAGGSPISYRLALFFPAPQHDSTRR